MMNRKFWLTFLLRVGGFGLLLATFAIFLPVDMMANIHRWLGVGEFPHGPITVYLARSTSALYAMHGAVMLLVSIDVIKYFRFVQLLGWLHAIFGIVIFFTGLLAPLPWYWVATEGPPVVGVGVLLLVLARKPIEQSDKTTKK